MDSKINLDELKEIVKDFCDEREWDQFHNAKELAIGIVTEGSELLQHFRFKSEKEADAMFNKKSNRQAISEEMADIFFFLLRLSQRYDIDISDELMKKIEKNESKYPIEKSKGLNKKYTELD